MKKKIVLSFALLFALVGITGCGSSKKASVKTNGKCNVFECMDLVSVDSSVEDINKIIGVEGHLQEGSDIIYVWDLSDETSIEGLMTNGKITRFDAEFPHELVKSKKADFSKFDEIKSALKTKESLTYDEFAKKVGDEGTVSTKTSSSVSYIWVNADGGYLTASFSASSGKCTIASGRF